LEQNFRRGQKILDDPASYTGAAPARAVEISTVVSKRLAQLKVELKKSVPKKDFAVEMDELKRALGQKR